MQADPGTAVQVFLKTNFRQRNLLIPKLRSATVASLHEDIKNTHEELYPEDGEIFCQRLMLVHGEETYALSTVSTIGAVAKLRDSIFVSAVMTYLAPHMRGPETTIDELSGQKQSTDRPNTSTGDQNGRPSGALLDKGGLANPRPAGGMAEASSRSTETQRKRRRSAITPVNIGALVNTSGTKQHSQPQISDRARKRNRIDGSSGLAAPQKTVQSSGTARDQPSKLNSQPEGAAGRTETEDLTKQNKAASMQPPSQHRELQVDAQTGPQRSHSTKAPAKSRKEKALLQPGSPPLSMRTTDMTAAVDQILEHQYAPSLGVSPLRPSTQDVSALPEVQNPPTASHQQIQSPTSSKRRFKPNINAAKSGSRRSQPLAQQAGVIGDMQQVDSVPETQPELLPPDSSDHDPTQSPNALRGLTQEILAKAVARSQIGEPSKDESSSDSEDDEDEVPAAKLAKPITANAEVLDRVAIWESQKEVDKQKVEAAPVDSKEESGSEEESDVEEETPAKAITGQQAKAVSQTVITDEAQESSSEEEDDSEDEAEQDILPGSAALEKSGQKPQQKSASGKLVADANNADSSSSEESEEDDSSDDEAEDDAQEGVGVKSAANRDPRLTQIQQTLNDKGAKRTGNKEDSSSEEETDDETDAEEDVEPQAAQKAVKVSGPTKEAGQQAKSSEEESSGSSSGEEDDSSDDDSEEESDTEPNGGAKAEKEAKGQARAVKRKMSFGQATDEEQDQGKHKKAKSLSTKQDAQLPFTQDLNLDAPDEELTQEQQMIKHKKIDSSHPDYFKILLACSSQEAAKKKGKVLSQRPSLRPPTPTPSAPNLAKLSDTGDAASEPPVKKRKKAKEKAGAQTAEQPKAVNEEQKEKLKASGICETIIPILTKSYPIGKAGAAELRKDFRFVLREQCLFEGRKRTTMYKMEKPAWFPNDDWGSSMPEGGRENMMNVFAHMLKYFLG